VTGLLPSQTYTGSGPPGLAHNVERIRTAVVFPAPFGPRRPHTLPSGIWRSKPSRAFTFPYRFCSPSAKTANLVDSTTTSLIRLKADQEPSSTVNPPGAST
jgi:hypothetical protein